MHCDRLSTTDPLIIPSYCSTTLNLLTVIQLWFAILLWFFKTVFTDVREHLYWNINKLLRHCTAVMQVNVFITGSLTEFTVFTRKVQALWLFWMHFPHKIIQSLLPQNVYTRWRQCLLKCTSISKCKRMCGSQVLKCVCIFGGVILYMQASIIKHLAPHL